MIWFLNVQVISVSAYRYQTQYIFTKFLKCAGTDVELGSGDLRDFMVATTTDQVLSGHLLSWQTLPQVLYAHSTMFHPHNIPERWGSSSHQKGMESNAQDSKVCRLGTLEDLAKSHIHRTNQYTVPLRCLPDYTKFVK